MRATIHSLYETLLSLKDKNESTTADEIKGVIDQIRLFANTLYFSLILYNEY